MGRTMEPLGFYLVIFCKASPVHSFTGTHLTPCFTRLDCKYDVSQSSVLLCITSKVLNYKTGGFSATIWVHAQVKVEPCKRIAAVRRTHITGQASHRLILGRNSFTETAALCAQ